jgi:NADPH-dependent 2,4-dienoyl-CoA reductase/sulfur reductase-like enzyme/bacterioferritin-associated ferredoxin
VSERPEEAQTLVVIGNGMASWKLCQKMVEHGAHESLRIVVFGEEPRPAYDRVHLTNLFAGGSDEGTLTLAPEDWYEEHGIELYLDDPVVHVDRARSRVCAASGREVEYNRLVFATGSRPFVPPMEGVELPGVFVYRTIDDVYAIEDYSQGATRAAVIGGGLLGLEAAKAIMDLGLRVHVIEHGPGLMHRQIDAKGAELLKENIEKLGVKVYVQKQVDRIDPAGDPSDEGEGVVGADRLVLTFSDGEKLVVDMVLISAGIRPRGELAQACGLICAPNGGIVVDDSLETSDSQIYAVGECATHRGKTYGLVVPAYRMVDVLVTNLLGGSASFAGADQSAKLKLMGITVAALGEHDGEKQPLTSALRYTTGGVYRKLVTRNGRLIGAVTIGDWENLDRIRESLNAPVPMSFFDMRRFRSTGNLWPKSESQKVVDWAPEALVCGCLSVTRGALSEAQTKGCATVSDLSRSTGAGSMCGSCKPLLADLLGVDEEARLPIAVHVGQVSVRDRGPRREPKRTSVMPPAPDATRVKRTSIMPPEPEVRPKRASIVPPDPDAPRAKHSSVKPAPDPDPDLDEAPTSMQLLQKMAVLAMPELEEKLTPSTPPEAPPDEVLEDEDDEPESDPDSYPGVSTDPFPEARRSWVPPPRLSILPPQRISSPPARPAVPAERGLRPLFFASIAAVVATIATAALPGVSGAKSVRARTWLEPLWTDGTWKQVTGYVLVGLCVLSLVISARKRLSWFGYSDVPIWRMVHGVVGVLALGVLALHTGLQLGSHMMLVLTLNLLMVALLGALAGSITVLSNRWSPVTARDRRLSSARAHLLVCWPLPVLIALHVLQIYFY